MQGIGSAIVGVTAVICAVFVPIAFLGGVTGTLYKQFAITITIVDAAVGDHRAHADAGAVRADPETGHDQAEADPGLRPFLRARHRAATSAAWRAMPALARLRRGLCSADRGRGVPVQARFPAGSCPRRTRARCSSRSTCPSAASPERVAGRAEEGRGHAGARSRGPATRRHPRLLGVLPLRQPGLRLRHPQGLEGAQGRRGSTCSA